MKKIFSAILYTSAALVLASCAKTVQPGPNDANKRFLEAWMQVNHPGITPTELGVYVLEAEAGEGAVVGKDGFAVVDYVISDLDGNISSYTNKETAKQLGKYDTTAYYGSRIWNTTEGTIAAGVSEILVGMKVGGRKKAIIPSWLMTYKVYDNIEDYFTPPQEKDKDKNSGTSTTTSYENAVYDFTVRDFTTDIAGWEIKKIGNYFAQNPSLDMTVADSLQLGFYYKQLAAPTDTTSFAKDSTIYINYTGRLLNGLVFDTTDERIAKDNGLYSASKEYAPVSVKWAEKAEDIKLGGSSVIPGFALTLWQMRSFEKGVGIFYSSLGYSYSGSGASIPGYAPLIFEIEIVAKPKE
jgi:FKBP-type peptidyl-prolyl cis-trans isomerase